MAECPNCKGMGWYPEDTVDGGIEKHCPQCKGTGQLEPESPDLSVQKDVLFTVEEIGVILEGGDGSIDLDYLNTRVRELIRKDKERIEKLYLSVKAVSKEIRENEDEIYNLKKIVNLRKVTTKQVKLAGAMWAVDYLAKKMADFRHDGLVDLFPDTNDTDDEDLTLDELKKKLKKEMELVKPVED